MIQRFESARRLTALRGILTLNPPPEAPLPGGLGPPWAD